MFDDKRRAAMSRAAKARVRSGQAPSNSRLLDTFKQGEVTWELYDLIPGAHDRRHIDNGGEWSNHKVVANPGKPGKANYWVGYNYADHRIQKNKDSELLIEHEPIVYAWVLATLDPDTYGGMM